MRSHSLKDAWLMVSLLILPLLLVGLPAKNYAASEMPPLPHGLPRHVLITKVPQLYQRSAECGPTSMTMVLRYWNVPVTKEEIDDDLDWHLGKGIAMKKLQRLASEYGLKSRIYSGNLPELMRQLAQRRPVIVRQWASEKSKQFKFKGPCTCGHWLRL